MGLVVCRREVQFPIVVEIGPGNSKGKATGGILLFGPKRSVTVAEKDLYHQGKE